MIFSRLHTSGVLAALKVGRRLHPKKRTFHDFFPPV